MDSIEKIRKSGDQIVTIPDHMIASFEVYSEQLDRKSLIYKVGVIEIIKILLPIFIGIDKIYLSPENLALVHKEMQRLKVLPAAVADDNLKDETCKKITTLRLSSDK